MAKFGVLIMPELDDKLFQTASLADRLGYDNIWMGDHLQYDIFSFMTYLMPRTQRIKLGTGVTNAYVRHPAIIAAAVATLNEISGGRAVLGLGSGGAEELQPFGKEQSLLRVREALEVMKPVLAGKKVSYEGKTVTLNNFQLHYLKKTSVPIYLAAEGPKMLELAGELADGVILGGVGAWPPAVKRSLEYVEAGAKRAGRRLSDLEVVCWTRIVMADDPRPLKELITPRVVLSLTGPSRARHIPGLFGLDAERSGRIKEYFQKTAGTKNPYHPLRGVPLPTKGFEGLVPEGLVEKHTLYGTPKQVIERIRQLVEIGVTNVSLLCWPPFDSHEDLSELRMSTLKAFAENVTPAFKS